MATTNLPTTTKAIVMASFPTGDVTENHFAIKEMPLAQIKQGCILIKTSMVSVDPCIQHCIIVVWLINRDLRMRMGRDNYGGSFKLGEPVTGWTVGDVIASMDTKYKVGDTVRTWDAPLATYAMIDSKVVVGLVKNKLTPEEALGVCGMPAMTAFFGMEIANPKQGETIVVSGGAGAVGCVVGQIAKMYGMKTVGIAGSDDKIKIMKDELGYDEVINYKQTKGREGMQTALRKMCPDGIDVYWDNVGGDTLHAASNNMTKSGRIISCGSIANYNKEGFGSVGDEVAEIGKEKGIKIHHLLVFDHKQRWEESVDKLAQWYREGKIKKMTTVYKGIQNVPKAFVDMFGGKNVGKMLIDVSF